MKKIILLFALFTSSALYKAVDAQVHVDINIGDQPVWGPEGYDYVDNYYFPDIDVYYNVPQQQFVYFDGRRWAFAHSLPALYGNFDLYRSYKVVINEPNPYLRNDYYHSHYLSYRGHYDRQPIIYNSRDSRYFAIANHPYHNSWMESRRQSSFDNRGAYGRVNESRSWNSNQRVDYNRSSNYSRENNNRSYGSDRGNNGNSYDRRGGSNGRYGGHH